MEFRHASIYVRFSARPDDQTIWSGRESNMPPESDRSRHGDSACFNLGPLCQAQSWLNRVPTFFCGQIVFVHACGLSPWIVLHDIFSVFE
jgi:hypothetical protein